MKSSSSALIMRNLIVSFCLIFFFSCEAAFSQSISSASTIIGAAAGPEGIAVTAEVPITSRISIPFSAGVGGEYDIAGGLVDYMLAIRKPRPFAWVAPRWYYGTGAETAGAPQGHFVGLKFKWTAGEKGSADKYRHSALVNLHWGHQQHLGTYWIFAALAGPGYAFDIKGRYGSIYPAFDLRVVYIFKQ